MEEEKYFSEWYQSNDWGFELAELPEDHKLNIMETIGFKFDFAQYKLNKAINDFANSFRFKWVGKIAKWYVMRMKIKMYWKDKNRN